MDNSNLSLPYSPLKEGQIRILQLLPGKDDEPLRGRLQHMKLFRKTRSQASENQAISYAWGPPDKPHLLYIGKKHAIPITQSLFDALRYFRYRTRSRSLWADAVCIDQADIPEKNAQVEIMYHIYRSAYQVLVWLGLSEDPARDAEATAVIEAIRAWKKDNEDITLDELELDHLETYHSDPQDLISTCMEQSQDALQGSENHRRKGAHARAMHGLVCLARLISSKSWFQRLWVVQETAHFNSNDLESSYCSDTFTWGRSALEHAMITINYSWTEISHCGFLSLQDKIIFDTWLDSQGYYGGDISASVSATMVTMTDHFTKLCSNPRDRIYALRNLLNLHKIDDLRPDCTIQIDELYRRFMVQCLVCPADDSDYVHRAYMLSLVGTQKTLLHSSGHLSWVVNFDALSSTSNLKRLAYVRDRGGMKWTIYSDSDWEVRSEPWKAFCSHFVSRLDYHDKSKLQVRGRVFARAQEAVECTPLSDMLAPNRHKREAFNLFVTTYFAYREILLPLFEQLYIPLNGGKTNDSERGDIDGPESDEEVLRFLAYPTHWVRMPDESDLLAPWMRETPDEFEGSINDLLINHRGDLGAGAIATDPYLLSQLYWVFKEVTQCPLAAQQKFWLVEIEGIRRPAWLPNATQEGDEICYMNAPWPFVVRPHMDGTYQLIGDCFVFSVPFITALGGEWDPDLHKVLPWAPIPFNMPDLQEGEVKNLVENMGCITLR